jgi:flagellar hook-associated protein 1 FlgK
MSSFDIGLTGLNAAQKGLDIIGNNIANAATEGYHRQVVDLTPAYSGQDGGLLIGDGVEVKGIIRLIDKLLEQEILRQQSSLGQVSQESTTLSSIEAAFGELAGDTGLSAAINKFFNALSNLNAHPDEIAYQNEVLTSADAMAGQFRTLGDFLTNLETQTKLQAENIVDQVNIIAGQIARLNDNIQRIEMSGGESGNLLDQRDELISQMSELTGVVTQQRDFGVVDVTVAGVPVVMGSATTQLEIGLNNEGQLGVTPAGAFTYQTTMDGGQLGGLLSLYNTTVDGIQSDLDTLASAIIQQVNQYHVGGVGSDGSFTELTGRTMLSENLSDFDPPVNDGSLFIRVTYTDPSTGEVTVTRHRIDIDASSDTLTTIAGAIDDIDGLSASAAGSRLSIQADADYKFDFLPAVLSSPATSTFTGSLPPTVSVSGVYTGTDNPTFTFTVVGSDWVGNGTLQLEVRKGTELIDTLNVGAGYAAGDYIELDNGIKIALSTGDLNADNSFTVAAFGNTDTSGFLAAVGINTFFSGSNASNMALSDNVADSPGRIATALGSDLTDNANALRLASLGDLEISDLNSLTVSQFYSQLVTNIGQQLSVKQISQSSTETLVQSLTNQQSDISGVDINDEAAQMLVFEQMFQAMAKYIGTVQTTLSSLMELL